MPARIASAGLFAPAAWPIRIVVANDKAKEAYRRPPHLITDAGCCHRGNAEYSHIYAAHNKHSGSASKLSPMGKPTINNRFMIRGLNRKSRPNGLVRPICLFVIMYNANMKTIKMKVIAVQAQSRLIPLPVCQTNPWQNRFKQIFMTRPIQVMITGG